MPFSALYIFVVVTMMDLFFTSHGLHKSKAITSPFVAPSRLRPSTFSTAVLLLDRGRRPRLLTLSVVEKEENKKDFLFIILCTRPSGLVVCRPVYAVHSPSVCRRGRTCVCRINSVPRRSLCPPT